MHKNSGHFIQSNQNKISAWLIIVNIILAIVFMNCIPATEDDFFIGILWVAIFAVILQALLVFSYKGKAPKWSKIVFIFFLLGAVLYGVFIAYALALGKAFQN